MSFLRAIIVADGDVRPGIALRGPAFSLVVAADGGALKASQIGLTPDVVVGDGDSLATERIAELRADGAEVIIHPVDKDESDTELAVREALARGATSIVIIGTFGGARFDHGVANLLLLTLPELVGIDVTIVDGASTARVIGLSGTGHLVLDGTAGDWVSLLALSERVEGVTADGLRFPLTNDTLLQGPTRGLSNELVGARAEVRTDRGRLCVIHTRRAEIPAND